MCVDLLYFCRDASGAAQRGRFQAPLRSKTAGGAGEDRPEDPPRVSCFKIELF